MDIVSSVAASRLIAQQRTMDVVANNIANASTPGFKAERVLFSDWVSKQNASGTVPGGGTISYTQDRATWREQQAGSLTHTGNPFDIAIAGDGYFTVRTPSGPRLTRDGRFGLMPDGTIADGSGNAVLDGNGQAMQLTPTDTRVTIAGDGAISSETRQIGRIGVVSVTDPMKITAEGSTRFRADAATAVVTAPNLVQGAVEGSNVQPVLETTRMMDGLRQFQFVSQLLQAEADRQQSAIDKLLPQGG